MIQRVLDMPDSKNIVVRTVGSALLMAGLIVGALAFFGAFILLAAGLVAAFGDTAGGVLFTLACLFIAAFFVARFTH